MGLQNKTILMDKMPDYCRGCTLWLESKKSRELKKKPLTIKKFREIYKLWREIYK